MKFPHIIKRLFVKLPGSPDLFFRAPIPTQQAISNPEILTSTSETLILLLPPACSLGQLPGSTVDLSSSFLWTYSFSQWPASKRGFLICLLAQTRKAKLFSKYVCTSAFLPALLCSPDFSHLSSSICLSCLKFPVPTQPFWMKSILLFLAPEVIA